MNLLDILVIVVGIAVVIMVLRFIGKMVVNIIGFLLIGAFLLYVLFVWRGGLLDIGNQDFMLAELQQKYCEEENYDPIKCNCIVEPLYDDIKSKYTNDEIVDLQGNKLKSLRVILKSINQNKLSIFVCLEENKSVEKWDEFLSDLKSFDIKDELKDTWADLKDIVK